MVLIRLFSLLSILLVPLLASPERVEVHAHIHFVPPQVHRSSSAHPAPATVIWLDPLSPEAKASFHASPPGHFRMAQKDKSFHPHLLVVPVGSTVEFPNLDPFFHNVFSQFNGRRFDLGLYEAGSTRDVLFNREGVSWIFCNIHPEMSAVIISLDTPYVAVSGKDGAVVIPGVAPGAYELHVWAEGADARQLQSLTRRVVISPSQTQLGTIQLQTTGLPIPHKNKFGDDYWPEDSAPY
jgi:plastocyanin